MLAYLLKECYLFLHLLFFDGLFLLHLLQVLLVCLHLSHQVLPFSKMNLLFDLDLLLVLRDILVKPVLHLGRLLLEQLDLLL